GVGCSQYAMQLSGSTIFVAPLDILPLRNIPVIAPDLGLVSEEIDAGAIADAIQGALRRLDLADGARPVAIFVPWHGSATFHRLHAVCPGLAPGPAAAGAPRPPPRPARRGRVGRAGADPPPRGAEAPQPTLPPI